MPDTSCPSRNGDHYSTQSTTTALATGWINIAPTIHRRIIHVPVLCKQCLQRRTGIGKCRFVLSFLFCWRTISGSPSTYLGPSMDTTTGGNCALCLSQAIAAALTALRLCSDLSLVDGMGTVGQKRLKAPRRRLASRPHRDEVFLALPFDVKSSFSSTWSKRQPLIRNSVSRRKAHIESCSRLSGTTMREHSCQLFEA